MLNGTTTKIEKQWAIFPVHFPRDGKCSCGKSDCPAACKHPIPVNGLLAATKDRQQIDRWWKANPTANIGIATGEPSKLLVIDIDGDEGERSIEIFQKEHGYLPRTIEVSTPHGRHLYFKFPAGGTYVSATAWLPGVDIRGAGGYVIAAGSKSLDRQVC
jgi:putative DNA primase/helicase